MSGDTKDMERSALLAFKDAVADMPHIFPDGETTDDFLKFKLGFLKGIQYMAYNEKSFLIKMSEQFPFYEINKPL